MTTENNFESIIRQYQWHELNAEQKAAIAGIAADEHAFNTAKSILLLVSEEKFKAPLLKPGLAAALHDKLPGKKRSAALLWYAAAASVILAAAGLWIYNPGVKDKPLAKRLNPLPHTVQPEARDTQPSVVVIPDTPPVKHRTRPNLVETPAPQQSLPIPGQGEDTGTLKKKQETVFMVANNPGYLDLLTELY